MVAFFEMLEDEQKREPGKVEQFFSSHPTPEDRVDRVREEVRLLQIQQPQAVGGFAKVAS
jgi:predicted Zn-dependent protease